MFGHAHTHATIDTKSEPEEAPSKTEEFQPLAARTTPPSLDHTPISFDSTPDSARHGHAYSARSHLVLRHGGQIADDPYHFIIPYQDTEWEGSEDEGPSSEEEEEAVPEGQQQTVLVVDTTADEPLGLGQSSRSVSKQQRVEETPAPRPPVRATWVDPIDDTVYTYILIYVPPVHVPVQTPPSSKWSSDSLPVSPSSLAVPTLVASPMTTPATAIAVDEDEFLEVGARLKLHESIPYDNTQRLDALPPALFEGYYRDLRELYTRLRAVRDEIFS
ncbi:hypothetical protein Tco_0619953 [Tanacetum coccineum]